MSLLHNFCPNSLKVRFSDSAKSLDFFWTGTHPFKIKIMFSEVSNLILSEP